MRKPKITIMAVCLILALSMGLTGCAGKGGASEEVKYTIDNIRDYVVGVDEPVELEDGSTKPLSSFPASVFSLIFIFALPWH